METYVQNGTRTSSGGYAALNVFGNLCGKQEVTAMFRNIFGPK